ncbi:MAG: acyl carrier protein [Prolixibacteraceae bacterium]|nr:acyl carrier protein [Prolixibacteraceae bacterium]
MGITEKRMYKVLRNVGIKRKFIIQASTIEDLYLDDFDYRLLVYYFENEFKVSLKDKEIKKLTSLNALHNFLKRKKGNTN